jgi:hypothetical protein
MWIPLRNFTNQSETWAVNCLSPDPSARNPEVNDTFPSTTTRSWDGTAFKYLSAKVRSAILVNPISLPTF